MRGRNRRWSDGISYCAGLAPTTQGKTKKKCRTLYYYEDSLVREAFSKRKEVGACAARSSAYIYFEVRAWNKICDYVINQMQNVK